MAPKDKSTEKDKTREKYEKMISSLGFDPERVNQQVSTRRKHEKTELTSESQHNLTNKTSLSLDDVLGNLKNDSGLKNQFMELSKGKAPLTEQMAPVKQERLARKANYEVSKKEVTRFQAQVKRNRESEQLDFTEQEEKEGVTLSSLNKNFTPQTEMEKRISEILEKSGYSDEKIIKAKEQEELAALSVEAVRERTQKLSAMKNIQFYQELKAKRVSKIKSKMYHKIKKKAKQKDQLRLMERLDEVDPELAQQYRDKEELKRVRERASLRHATKNKYQQNLARFGEKEGDTVRDAIHEQARLRKELTKKMKSTSDRQGEDDSSDEELFNKVRGSKLKEARDLEDALMSDEEDDIATVKAKAMKALENEVQETDLDKLPKKGLFGMSFMRKAIEKRNNEARENAKQLLEELQREKEQVEAESSDDEGKKIGLEESQAEKLDGIKKLGNIESSTQKKKNKKATNKEDSKELGKFIKTAVRGQELSTMGEEKEPEEDSSKKPSEKSTEKPQKTKKRSRQQQEINMDDESLLEGLNKEGKTKKQKDDRHVRFELSKDINLEDSDNENMETGNLVAEAFADGNNYAEEFAKEKLEEMEEDVPEDLKPVQGWGSWAGDGVKQRKIDPRKLQEKRRKKILEHKKARQDGSLEHVIISEKRDKKFERYLVDKLPHPFQNVKQYAQANKLHLGKEVNPVAVYSRLVQPDVITKPGQIIKPLRHNPRLPKKPLDSLVINKKKPNQRQPKF
eukprot:CAMPEP_0114979572 /NCGR_PEP_ID=MMETSP0216-20121206/4444_1 /TAXON_ID=223996 /ORGANISM="Protocruzia adherens, Strain Boccale" /LENGTH=739 /DNA_ID=CAMNT_0002340909 /DNA_START=32 /DNA_END=2251 /DNA_ORIENTATION=-